nr:MAG TPA: hypothetical protein [Caudoviricetes sp.]
MLTTTFIPRQSSRVLLTISYIPLSLMIGLFQRNLILALGVHMLIIIHEPFFPLLLRNTASIVYLIVIVID